MLRMEYLNLIVSNYGIVHICREDMGKGRGGEFGFSKGYFELGKLR